MEKQREKVLLLVKKNANIRSLLTNKIIMLADYAGATSLPKNKESTRETGTRVTRNNAKSNIILEDYTDAKSFPSNEEITRVSIGTSVFRNKAKRKCSKGAVASIVEVLEGGKDMQEQAKVLKAVLNTKSI